MIFFDSFFHLNLGIIKLIAFFPEEENVVIQCCYSRRPIVFLKRAEPGLFLIYFCLFKHKIHFLQQINAKNVHPVYSAGI